MSFAGTVAAVAVGAALARYVVRAVGLVVLALVFALAFCSPDHPVPASYSYSRETVTEAPLPMTVATTLDVVTCQPWTTVVTYPDVVTQRCGRWTLVSRLQESRE